MSSSRSVHVIIHGRVQGVGFRAWAHHQAQLHGLQGWVRNRRDGRVEAVFAGPGELVEVMLRACWQGPRGASVECIEAVSDPDNPEGAEGEGFQVLPTV
ncbi:acylphosphatase [Microvirga sp. 2TAF3]|uniref:acylphosphatase n=1 Tax=Microvirga sp. 2TAF3 TaxID=3233014 RepID=UPI003F96CA6E